MPSEIELFNGHDGYVVRDTGSRPGELDPGDAVQRAGQPIGWHDSGFAAARDEFQRMRATWQSAKAQLTDFGRALEPGASSKKAKRKDLDAIIADLEGVAGRPGAPGRASPALRSRADTLIAGAQGMIAHDYASGLLVFVGLPEIKQYGTAAFASLARAIATDRNNESAWYGMALTLLKMRVTFRGTAESALGISVKDELPKVIVGLAPFSDVPSRFILELALLAHAVEQGTLSPDEKALLAETRAALERRAGDPALQRLQAKHRTLRDDLEAEIRRRQISLDRA